MHTVKHNLSSFCRQTESRPFSQNAHMVKRKKTKADDRPERMSPPQEETQIILRPKRKSVRGTTLKDGMSDLKETLNRRIHDPEAGESAAPSVVIRRLIELRERAGYSIRAFAKAIEENPNTYASFEKRFKKQFVPMEMVKKIGPALMARGIPAEEIAVLSGAATPGDAIFTQTGSRHNSDTTRLYELRPSAIDEAQGVSIPRIFSSGKGIPTITVKPIKVIGRVQAGLFKSALEWPPEEQFEVDVPIRAPFSRIPTFGLQISGPSMDLVFPDQSIVICARILDLGAFEVHSNHYVVVLRRDSDDGVEATVKQLQIDESGTAWLWPRSSHPDFQQPWKVQDLTRNPEDADDLAIWALVVADTRMRV